MPSKHKLMLLAGNSNPRLWRGIIEELGDRAHVIDAEVGRHRDGEAKVVIKESIRGGYCFVLQSTCNSPRPNGSWASMNDNYVELLAMMNALKMSGAHAIVPVIPYYGYGRQDKRIDREPLMAQVIAHGIQAQGAVRIIGVDFHSAGLHNCFTIPVDGLEMAPTFATWLQDNGWAEPDCVVVSPDAGGYSRAVKMASRLGLPDGVVPKERPKPGQARAKGVMGDVFNKRVILYDDMIDSGGSSITGGRKLREYGAKGILLLASHGVFSKGLGCLGTGKLFDRIVISNTIPNRPEARSSTWLDKFERVSAVKLLAEGIWRNYNDESIRSLFNAG